MNEWKTVRLGDVCEQINGVSYKPADVRDSLTNESCTLLRANNIFEDKLNYDELVFVDKKRVSNNQYMKKGDIIICASSGSKHLVGKAACLLEDKELTFGAFCKVIRADSIQYDYLKHYFFSPTYRSVISHLSEGANINNIKAENLENLQIPLPPIETQKQIASTLDKCTSVIEKHKKMLQKYDTLIKSRFIEMFGDPHNNTKYTYKNVGDFTTVTSGGTPDRKNIEYWKNGNIPWVKTTELQNNELTNVEEFITQKGLDESSAKMMPIGTLLIAMYGQGKTRGMTAYLGIEASTNQACACILPSKVINQKFLWYYFILSYDKLRDLAKGGNQPNLNGNMIKDFPVLMPPIEMQNEYVSFVQQIDKSKFAVQKSLEKTETLYKSLMQQYFG